MENEKINWFLIFVLALIGSGSGLARVAQQANDGKKFKLLNIFLENVVSIFATLIFGLFVYGIFPNIYVSLAVGGLAGNLGVHALAAAGTSLIEKTSQIAKKGGENLAEK